jgi:glucokinase
LSKPWSRSGGIADGRVVVVDAGGTHVRFAIAQVAPGARPLLGPVRRYRTADHPDLASAWRRFAADAGTALPDAASIAVAAPMGDDMLRFVNSSWTVDTRTLQDEIGVGKIHFLNDFGAMAYGVSMLRPEEMLGVQAPSDPLFDHGVTSIIGPGTGLGVAILLRRGDALQVIETEGAHIAFAPLDPDERAIAECLRHKFGRVSVERLAAGPGLAEIVTALGGGTTGAFEVGMLWDSALSGTDPLAARALDHFVAILGSAVGDLALAHGSNAVVLTGAIANRAIDRLRQSDFIRRFRAKGRYSGRMERIPIKVATNLDTSLLGAAVAFAHAAEA